MGEGWSERRLAWAVAALVALAFGAVVPFLGRDALGAALPDDAFYYFQIARQVATGRGFTFDGIHATNGFHPLWLLALAPVFRLVPGDVLPLRVVVLIQAALAAGAAAAIFRILCGRIGRAGALAAALAVAATPGAPSVFRAGVESTLLLCLMVAVWRSWLGLSANAALSIRGGFGLGLLCGLAFLARLEAIVLVPALLLLGGRRWLRHRTALLALIGLPALTVCAYLAWNASVFGTPLPVSALVKAHWARQGPPAAFLRGLLEPPWAFHTLVCRLWGPHALVECPPSAIRLFWALVALALGAAWRFRRGLRAIVRESGAGVVLLSSGLIVLADRMSLRHLESWYDGPILLSTAVLAGALLSRRPRLARIAAAAAVLATLGRVPLTAWMLRETEARHAPYRIVAGDWARQNIPASDRIGSWNAGTFAYFSHRTVVNLDGLVNDIEYFRRVIKERDLEGYLRRERIVWLADQACGARPTPRNYLAQGGAAHLEPEFDLAARFFHADAPDGCPGYAVWRRKDVWGPADQAVNDQAPSSSQNRSSKRASR